MTLTGNRDASGRSAAKGGGEDPRTDARVPRGEARWNRVRPQEARRKWTSGPWGDPSGMTTSSVWCAPVDFFLVGSENGVVGENRVVRVRVALGGADDYRAREPVVRTDGRVEVRSGAEIKFAIAAPAGVVAVERL